MTAYPAAAQLAAVQSRPSCTFENDQFRHSHQNDEGQLGGGHQNAREPQRCDACDAYKTPIDSL